MTSVSRLGRLNTVWLRITSLLYAQSMKECKNIAKQKRDSRAPKHSCGLVSAFCPQVHHLFRLENFLNLLTIPCLDR